MKIIMTHDLQRSEGRKEERKIYLADQLLFINVV